MKITTFLTALSASAVFVAAQTPPGFNVTTVTTMAVLVQPANISITPGLLVSKDSTSNQPVIQLPRSITSTGPFVAMMIDNNVPLVHWLAPNMYSNGTALVFNASGPNAGPAVGAPYIAPSPPANSEHTYVVLVFAQPSVWNLPSYYSQLNPPPSSQSRMGIDIGNLASASNLGQPIAANYFLVANGTVSGTTMTPVSTTGSMTATGSSGTTATTQNTVAGTRSSSVATSTGSATSSSASNASPSASPAASKAAAPGKISEDLMSGFLTFLMGMAFLVL